MDWKDRLTNFSQFLINVSNYFMSYTPRPSISFSNFYFYYACERNCELNKINCEKCNISTNTTLESTIYSPLNCHRNKQLFYNIKIENLLNFMSIWIGEIVDLCNHSLIVVIGYICNIELTRESNIRYVS